MALSRYALATTYMTLLLTKRRQLEGFRARLDDIMRHPCHAEHVDEHICFLRCNRHFSDIVHDSSPSVIDLRNDLLATSMYAIGPGRALVSAKLLACVCGYILYRTASYRPLAIMAGLYIGVAVTPWLLVFSGVMFGY